MGENLELEALLQEKTVEAISIVIGEFLSRCRDHKYDILNYFAYVFIIYQ